MFGKEKAVQLRVDEEIIAIFHRDWFVFFLRALGIVILYMLPFLLLFLLHFPLALDYTLTTFSYDAFSLPLIVFFSAFWTLIMWMYFFNEWTDYYLDAWVVTNKRIIDIEQKGFFQREVSSFRMERIQDITFEINGFLATLFDYGEMHVQTAGERTVFIMRDAPHPRKIKDLILERSDDSLEKRGVSGG